MCKAVADVEAIDWIWKDVGIWIWKDVGISTGLDLKLAEFGYCAKNREINVAKNQVKIHYGVK